MDAQQVIDRYVNNEMSEDELVTSLSGLTYRSSGGRRPERPENVSSPEFAVWWNAVEDGTVSRADFDVVVRAKNAKRIPLEAFLEVRRNVYGG